LRKIDDKNLREACRQAIQEILRNVKQIYDKHSVKEKVNLRIVKIDRNLGRSYKARIGRQKKDLTIE
jgi:hypothetical protein